MHTCTRCSLLTYLLTYLPTYVSTYCIQELKQCCCAKLSTLLFSPWLKRWLCFTYWASCSHTCTHAYIHTPALHWHTHNSFHRQRVSISPCKQTKCTYTHLTSRFLLTYLLTCSASNYLLHIIGKTMTPNKNVCTPCTKTKILLYLLTSLLTYYVMYSSSPSQKFLEWSKQQCHHADHHWASYSLMFIVLACS